MERSTVWTQPYLQGLYGVNTVLLGELVCWIEKSKTFTRVSTQSHGQLLTMTKEVHKLDNEALDHWIDMDEMAYVNIDPVELWISNAHLSATPLIKVSIHFHT